MAVWYRFKRWLLRRFEKPAEPVPPRTFWAAYYTADGKQVGPSVPVRFEARR